MAIESGALTGSAPVQGRLWGASPGDWAELLEQTALPLHSAALDAAYVTRGTRLLDAGCGAGIAALLAALRGATVSAVDAADGMLDVARGRLPGADVRQADLESLPYTDGTFDAVIAVNSLFYAADAAGAARELARVVRPGGRVVATAWGPAERCEYGAVMAALGPLMPPPPPGSKPGGPFALAVPGALEALLAGAGLAPLERGEAACAMVFPNARHAWQATAAAGVTRRAIEASGEERVRAAVMAADAGHTRPDGSVRYDNVFIWVVARRT